MTSEPGGSHVVVQHSCWMMTTMSEELLCSTLAHLEADMAAALR